jgi:hypothetical protein
MVARLSSAALLTLAGLFGSLPAHAQASGSTGTLVNGRVVVQVFVTLSDEETPYHPVVGLPVGFVRSTRDTAVALTDASGSAMILLAPGQYRLVSLAPTQWKGLRYSWNVPLTVEAYMQAFNLRRNQASVAKDTRVATATSDNPREQSAGVELRTVAPKYEARIEAPESAPNEPSIGERSHSSGFFLGAGLEGNGLATNEAGSTTESGSGAGLILGYGFSQRWSMYGNLSGAVMNDPDGGTYSLAHLDIGARVHFRTGPNVVVPFIQFGLTGRAVSADVGGSTVTGSGGGVVFGGGINAYFTPAVAFSGAVTWTVGNFDDFRVDNSSIGNYSVNATTARLHLGIVWFPH